MKAPSWRTTLRAITILAWLVSIVWLIVELSFEPLITFLTGTATFLLSLKASDEPFTSLPASIISPEQHQRNRRNMLQLVWNTWVEGALKQSLHNKALIELGMEMRPDAVEHPWDMVMQMPDRGPMPVAPGTTMLELFDLMSGSLLILGEPGSGKTMMLLELCRQLIEQSKKDPLQQIPVLFNLSSWKPEPQKKLQYSFADWLVRELQDKYSIPNKISRSWLENDELVLLLDGLDEVREEYRETCVQAINAFRAEHSMPLVVCSRGQEYQALSSHFNLRGAVSIQPLTNQQVDDYLQAEGAGLTVIHEALKRDRDLQEFARTPLILDIMMLAYRNASEEDLRALEKTRDYLKHLSNVYINQMFTRRGVDRKYTAENSIQVLSWLANWMMASGQSQFYIEDIKFSRLPHFDYKVPLTFGLIGLLSEIFMVRLSIRLNPGHVGVQICPLIIFLIGVLIGFVISGMFVGGSVFRSGPSEKFVWTWKNYQGRGLFSSKSRPIDVLFAELIFGLIGGLMVFSFFGNLSFSLIGGLFFIIVGLGVWSIAFLKVTVAENRSSPGDGIRASLINSLKFGLIGLLSVVLICGIFGGLIGKLTGDLIFGMNIGLEIGLSLGLIVGLAVGFMYGGNFLISHFVSRCLLYRSDHIPLNIKAFLESCTKRIFMYRVGGGYIFVHRMLMEHFAEMKLGNSN